MRSLQVHLKLSKAVQLAPIERPSLEVGRVSILKFFKREEENTFLPSRRIVASRPFPSPLLVRLPRSFGH